MTRTQANALMDQAQRLGVPASKVPYGLGVQVRFTGDHWHKTFASAALALLREVPNAYRVREPAMKTRHARFAPDV